MKKSIEYKVNGKIDSRTFTLRDIYMRATFYHVYYFVRKYFDEMKVKAESCVICGILIKDGGNYNESYTE